jgi:hypothetical protein
MVEMGRTAVLHMRSATGAVGQWGPRVGGACDDAAVTRALPEKDAAPLFPITHVSLSDSHNVNPAVACRRG